MGTSGVDPGWGGGLSYPTHASCSGGGVQLMGDRSAYITDPPCHKACADDVMPHVSVDAGVAAGVYVKVKCCNDSGTQACSPFCRAQEAKVGTCHCRTPTQTSAWTPSVWSAALKRAYFCLSCDAVWAACLHA